MKTIRNMDRYIIIEKDLIAGKTELIFDKLLPDEVLVTGLAVTLFYNKQIITDKRKYNKYFLQVYGNKYSLFRLPAIVLMDKYPMIPSWFYMPDFEYKIQLICDHPFKKRYSIAFHVYYKSKS